MHCKSIIFILISCLSTLVIGDDDDSFQVLSVDKLTVSSGETYYFRTNKSIENPACTDPKAVVCVVHPNGTAKILNAGHFEDFKYAKESTNHYSYTFESGQNCTVKGRNFRSRFDFFCPHKDEKIENPIMLASTGDKCSLNFFVWHHGSSCQSVMTSGCKIRIPDFAQELDLSLLKENTFYDVYNQNKTKHVQLNICHGISGSYRCSDDVFACDVTNPSESVVIMDKEPIIFTDYDLKAKVVNLKYFIENNRVNIQMSCGQDDFKIEYIDEAIDDHGIKSYNFKVVTRSVCLTPVEDCKFKASNSQVFFDLSRLRDAYQPWKVFDESRTGRTFYLSICKPLFPGFQDCPGNMTSVCAEDAKTYESFALGSFDKTSTKFKIVDDDQLILEYDPGLHCNGKFKYSTQIIFQCSDQEDGPKLFDSFGNCTYIFQWKTPQACPHKTLESKGCSVKDKHFGHTFNLTELRKPENYKVSDNLKLNVCSFKGLIGNGSCAPNAAICDGSKVIGWAKTEELHFSGQVQLTYQGERCLDGKTKNYSATIDLHCDQSIGQGVPVLSWNQTCSYNFIWPSTYACPPFDAVECSVMDENMEVFDFASLALSDDNYVIPYGSHPGQDIVLNLCRSLVHSSAYQCPYKSSICLVNNDKTGNATFTSLGQVSGSPYLDKHNRLVIDYINGSPCKDASTKETHISAKIIFNCRMDKKDSKPKFVDKKGCTYTFWWEHHLACPKNSSHLITQDSCMVTDQDLNHVFDLRPLKNKIFEAKNDQTKKLSVCSILNMSPCGSSSAACLVKDKGYKNIGNVNDRLTLQANEPVLHYDNEISHTSIHFKCPSGSDANSTYLVFMIQIKNHYYFELYTPLACPKVKPKENEHASHSTKTSTFWSFLPMICVILIAVTVLIVLKKKPHYRESLHSKVTWAWRSLWQKRRGSDDNSHLIENTVTIPTFGGLGEAEEDDEDLILA